MEIDRKSLLVCLLDFVKETSVTFSTGMKFPRFSIWFFNFYGFSVLTFLRPLLSLYFVKILFLEKYTFACFPAYFNQSIFHSKNVKD